MVFTSRLMLKNQPWKTMALFRNIQRGYRQMHNLHEINYTAHLELQQRTAKYLERTDRVYLPSKTIEFDRNGELLLYSCENIKNSTIYFKYPYCMYDAFMPVSWYIYFVNPFMWKWQVICSIFYLTNMFAWMPHVLYWKALDRKIHRLLLLRGGKYVKIYNMNPSGDTFFSWANINEFHILTEDYQDFADKDNVEFLNKEGQLKYEVQCQLENYVDQLVTVQDEIIYFMREGKVHQPEIFEMVLRGYNIETSNFVINTEHNMRYMEPHHNQ